LFVRRIEMKAFFEVLFLAFFELFIIAWFAMDGLIEFLAIVAMFIAGWAITEIEDIYKKRKEIRK